MLEKTISLYPFFIATILLTLILLLMTYNQNLIKGNMKINKEKYTSNLFNKFHILSYQLPFKWFVDNDEDLTPEGHKLLKNLHIAGLSDKFTPQSYMAMKVYVFAMAIFTGVITSTLLANSKLIIETILGFDSLQFDVLGFGLDYKLNFLTSDITLIAIDFRIIAVFMLLSLYPSLYLRGKIKSYESAFSKDLPVLQMFIILMLRSRKTTTEIFYGLSKVKTVHGNAFKQAHRMYIRNQSEGFAFIKSYFEGNRFVETFALIEEMGEFAREDILTILQANLKNITEDSKLMVQKKAGVKLVYSQASMVFPFAGVIIMGAVPVVVYALNLMSLKF